MVGPLRCGTEELVISGKEPSLTTDQELSWALLTDQDVEAIIGTSNELSGFTKTDRRLSRPFQKRPHKMKELDLLARRYGCLPSDLLKLSLGDYQLNLMIAAEGCKE